ncbi:MAG: spermidine synthase [Sphingomonas bacterium]|nr:spermidine synthase [Sphingomonas bacterium]MDB5682444.1 spermidine synthase [Sphingomonas bacterium]MDB5717839.1 spermidine synthase [Sphingomonas bacterium]
MVPRILIDEAETPGGGSLRLLSRGDDFSIMLGANELTSSRFSASEETLATASCERISGVPAPHLLIGGLGMGFTLRAALACLPAGAAITVAELVPQVVAWAEGPLAHLHGDSLADPRVTVLVRDVRALIGEAIGRYDAILLDVDNGPDGITHSANDRLYDAHGLAAARVALRPGGILAVWSAGPDAAFAERLRKVGFEVEEVRTRATRGRSGAHHVIWLATKPGGSPETA